MSPIWRPVHKDDREAIPYTPIDEPKEKKNKYQKAEDFQSCTTDSLRYSYKLVLWSQRPSVEKGNQLYSKQKDYSLHDINEKPDPIMVAKYGLIPLSSQPKNSEFGYMITDKNITVKMFWWYLGKKVLIKTWTRPLPVLLDTYKGS